MTNSEPEKNKQGPPQKVIVVLPAYNEEKRLARLLSRINDALQRELPGFQIVVVNDGSSDATGEIARGFAGQVPLVLETHEKNLGLGATIRDGIAAAVRLSSARDIIITMDADDTHPPELIPEMAAMIGQGFDVVIASRYRRGSQVLGVPLFRRFLSRAASIVFQAAFPIRGVRDYTCGFRAYRVATMGRAFERYGSSFIDQQGFQCMVDILLKLSPLHVRFAELPFVLRYDLKEGASKMKVGATVRKTLLLLLKRRVMGV